jgi:hypothetical protein
MDDSKLNMINQKIRHGQMKEIENGSFQNGRYEEGRFKDVWNGYESIERYHGNGSNERDEMDHSKWKV